MPPSREDALAKKIEDLRRKVRALPRGSDVCGFLDREVTEFAQLLREDLTVEREEAASTEADFPPCGVSPLRQPKDIGPGPQAAPGPNHPR